LFVAYEQGLGNQIAMARFFERLRPLGSNVTVETPPEMLGLMRRSFPDLRFAEFTTWQPLDRMDVHLPLMQLPAVLQVASERDFAAPATYLRPDPVRVNVLRQKLGIRPGQRNVGVVWHGNRSSARERWRVAPLSAWKPLAGVTGTRFHSLQFEATPAELAAAPFDLEATHELIADMDDTAALVTLMDLVVSVDTSVIHLAGALGRPAWLPLSVRSDYRWGVGRSNSPWYSTLRNFRQRTLDDWRGVFGEIAAAFEAFARPSSKAAP
jgi:hypothetical protein